MATMAPSFTNTQMQIANASLPASGLGNPTTGTTQPMPAGPTAPPVAPPAAPQGTPQVRPYTPPVQAGTPGGINNPNSNASTDAQQYLKELYDRLSNMGTPGWQDLYQKAADQYTANMQGKTSTDTSANYYRKDSVGNVWQTTPGSPSGFQYGSLTPTPGVDVRDWTHINNPLAYQYGGQYGGAAAEQNRYAQMGQAAGGTAAPQMNLGAFNNIANQYGGDTNNALAMLQAQASGQGPSIADAQMQQGLSQARQAQMQQAASARGGGANLIAAEQMAGSNASQQQSASLGQGAVARAQEQIGAQQAYGNLANQAYSTQGGLAAQLAQNQATFQQSQNQLNQQGQLAYEQMRQGVFNSQMNSQQAAEAANSGAYQFGQNQQMQQQAMDNANRNALVGGLLTAGGAVVGTLVGGPAGGAAGAAAGGAAGKAVSDVRSKENIQHAGNDIDATLAQMGAYAYNYNRPDLPRGKQVGTMAQQLQGTPAGAQMVGKDPQTGQLVIQGPQATNFSLAALARLNERIAALEGGAKGQAPPSMSFADMKRADLAKLPKADYGEQTSQPQWESPEQADARANMARASAFAPAPPAASYQPGMSPVTPASDLPVPMSYVESLPGQRRPNGGM